MKAMYRANLRSGEPITEALVSKETKNDVWFSIDGHEESLERKATFSYEWYGNKASAIERVEEFINIQVIAAREELDRAHERLEQLLDIKG